jgi:hypothetical protein
MSLLESKWPKGTIARDFWPIVFTDGLHTDTLIHTQNYYSIIQLFHGAIRA